ncbi:MAG: GNAT family N-acetyltransferase [Alphaproteobacteria bacterium]|nr:GNAT family N-acetyltransferase [Alphaproteobacteria bacterium]
MIERPRIGPVSHADLASLIRLGKLAEWNTTREDWLVALSSSRFIGHRDSEGRLITCGCLTPYEANKGMLGLIITDPDYGRMGLGGELVSQLVTLLPSQDTNIGLIATDMGVGLYSKHGFREVGKIDRRLAYSFQNDAQLEALPEGWRLEKSLPVKDLSALIRLDAAQFGAPRGKMIKRRFGHCDQRLFLYDSEDTLKGFILGHSSEKLCALGPIIAPNAQLAAYMVGQLDVKEHKPLQLDVPLCHTKFVEYLEQLGFEKNGVVSPIMMRGNWEVNTGWGNYFGLAAQCFL